MPANGTGRHDPEARTIESVGVSFRSTDFLHTRVSSGDQGRPDYRRDVLASQNDSQQISAEATEPPTGANSPGYNRTEILASNISVKDKAIIFMFIMILATAHSIDNFLRFEVVRDLEKPELIGAINAISTVGTATLTPIISKSADVFGRPQTLLVSVFSYVLGTSLQAVSLGEHLSAVTLFSAGAVFWTIGFLGVISMFEIIIADVTSMRMRVLMFYIPALPYLATIWLNMEVRDSLAKNWSLRWRFRWSAVIYTACSVPLIVALFVIERRTKKRMRLALRTATSEPEKASLLSRVVLRFQQMDVLGWVFFAGMFTCILAPWPAWPIVGPHRMVEFTDPSILSVLGAGILCIPLFYYAEKYAKYPLFSKKILWERRIVTALAMGFLYHLGYYVQHTYLFVGLIVRYDESGYAAGRTLGLYTFASTLFGTVLAGIISISQDLKWYLRIGTFLYLASFVIQIGRSSGIGNGPRLAVTSSQFLMGIAGGLFPLPAMALIQSGREPAQLATLVGAYMTACRIGASVGQGLAGAIWTNLMDPNLHKAVEGANSSLVDDDSIVDLAQQAPENFRSLFLWDSPTRKIIVHGFAETHRYLCLVGITVSTLLIILTFLIHDASLKGPKEDEEIELQPIEPNDEGPGADEVPRPLPRSRFNVIM